MNKLQVFNNKDFGEIRTITDEEDTPLLCLADVCKILDIKNVSQCKNRLNQKGICFIDTLTKGGNQKLLFIDENNLYKCIFQSNKLEAEKFTEWVTSEVLPTIRKHGMYATEELIINPDLAIKVFSELKKEKEKRIELENKVEKDKPKVLFAEAVKGSYTSIPVGDLAKLIYQGGNKKIGQNRLYKILREKGYLIKKGQSKNMPTQKSLEQGLFEVKESIQNLPNGIQKITRTTKVTGKGQIHFMNLFSSVKVHELD